MHQDGFVFAVTFSFHQYSSVIHLPTAMNVLRLGSRRATQLSRSAARPSTLGRRSYASPINIPFAPPPVPTIEGCPAPTCQCREIPAGLDIEREQNINGSMPTYAEQVLISTGKNDWTSRIEDDEGSALVCQIKDFLGPKGKYSDVGDTSSMSCC
jgi:hypothetical protein